MIDFAVSAWTLEMSLNTDSPFCQFGGEFCPHSTGPLRSKQFQQNESYFHILHKYKLGLNGLCHIRGTFY